MIGVIILQAQWVQPQGLDSLRMSQVWSLPMGSATAVGVQGDTVVVALGPKLVLMEVGDSLRDVKTLTNVDAPGAVTLLRDIGMGKMAAVIGDTALYTFDLATLQFSNTYYRARKIYDLVANSDYLFVADSNVDVISRSNLSLVGQYTPPVGVAKGVDFIYDTVLAVACSTGGLRTVLVLDPSYPVEMGSNTSAYIGRVRTIRLGDSVYAYGARDYSYVGYDVYIYNVTDITSPVYITYSRGNTYSSPLWDMVLDTLRRVLAVTAGNYGVQIWFVKDDGRLEYWTRHDPGAYYTMAYSQKKGALWLVDNYGNLRGWSTPDFYGRLRYDSPGTVKDVEAYGGYYIAADGLNGFFAIKFNYEWNWSLLGSFDTEGTASGVALDYPRTYIADGSGGIYYYNFTVNDTLGHFHLSSGVANQLALAKLNTVLLVAALPRDLYILDVSDPQNMDSLAHYTVSSGILVDVAAEGNYAYLALGSGGVEILDISDPSSPSVVSRFNAPGDVNALTVKEGKLYLACGGSFDGVAVYDVSNPSNPQLLGQLPMLASPQNIKGPFTYLGKSVLFVTSGTTLYTVDVTDPHEPYLMLRHRTSYQVNAAVSPPFQERYVLVANAENGLLLWQWGAWVDTANSYTASFQGNPVGVAPAESLAGVVFLDSLTSKAQFFDASNPESPSFVSSFGGSPAQALEMEGHYIVLNWGNRYIDLNDLSDPTNPQEVYWVDLGSGNLGKLEAVFDTVVVAVYQGQYLRSYVVRNDSLIYQGQLNIGSQVRDLFFNGTYLWLTTSNTLQAVDVSDPSNMSVVGLFSGFNSAGEVVVFDTLAFVVDQYSTEDTIRIIDTSPLYWMEQVATWATDTPGTKLDLRVHVPNDSAILYVLNGNRVSLYTVDLPDSMPFDDTLGYYVLAEAPRDFAVFRTAYIYLALGQGGMAALKVDIPFLGADEDRPLLFTARIFPNPSTSSKLLLRLPSEARVLIRLFDLAGRRAAVLADGKMEAGEHLVSMPENLRRGVYVVEVKVNGKAWRGIWVKR